jgi:hypothetical protein
VLSLGQGALMSMSLKQKINTKSSTEAKLVGADNAMNFVEWVQGVFRVDLWALLLQKLLRLSAH